MRSVAQNAAFRSAVQSQLARLAAAHGLAFEPEASVPAEIAAAQIKAIEGALKDDTPQLPVGLPIALLFISAALIFLPSTFKSVGGTLFGDAAVQAVEGIVPFG